MKSAIYNLIFCFILYINLGLAYQCFSDLFYLDTTGMPPWGYEGLGWIYANETNYKIYSAILGSILIIVSTVSLFLKLKLKKQSLAMKILVIPIIIGLINTIFFTNI